MFRAAPNGAKELLLYLLQSGSSYGTSFKILPKRPLAYIPQRGNRFVENNEDEFMPC
jgi:hypothetical protein